MKLSPSIPTGGAKRIIVAGASALVLALAAQSGSPASATPNRVLSSSPASALDIVDEEMAHEMADYYGISVEEAEDRVVEQQSALDFKEALPESVLAEWGGGVVDQSNGGARTWYVATPDAQRALTAKIAARPDLKATAVLVDHTLSELESGAKILSQSLAADNAIVTEVSVDVAHNGLSVSIPSDNTTTTAFKARATTNKRSAKSPAATAAENSQRVAADVSTFSRKTSIPIAQRKVKAEEPAQVDGCTAVQFESDIRYALQCDAPLRGGPIIFNDVEACSGAFHVRSKSDNKLFLLTAGHCAAPSHRDGTGDRDVPWYIESPSASRAEEIGPWHNSVWNNTDGDGAIISVTSPDVDLKAGQPIVYVGASTSSGKDTTADESYDIDAQGVWGDLDTNDWLCKTGGADWTDCGRYTGTVDTSVGDEHNSITTTFREFDTMHSCQGDSGGPVIGSKRAWGLVSGGEDPTSKVDVQTYDGYVYLNGSQCFSSALIMALQRPMDALNVRLVTTANP